MKISAVIPVYNEEKVIDEFSTRLVKSLEELGPDYEAIFVVEGKDSTLARLNELGRMNPRIKVEYSEKRLGLGKAMKRGMSLIDDNTDFVLTMDADLNHQPEEIGRLLRATGEADVVVGSRSRTHGMVGQLPFFKRMVSGGTNWLLKKSFRIPSSDITSGFRVYSAKAIKNVREELTSKNFEITAELLVRAKKKGLSITEVPITFTPRPRGISKLSFVRSGIGYARLFLELGL